MRVYRLLLGIVLTAVFVAGPLVPHRWTASAESATSSPDAVPKPAVIHAQLFYRDKGTFSRDVLADTSFRYWNATIGEGSAEGRVSAALITVDVRALPGESLAADTLRFEARTSTGLLLQRDVPLRRAYDGTLSEAFLVYGVGCERLRLTATIRRNGEKNRLERVIPFECGE